MYSVVAIILLAFQKSYITFSTFRKLELKIIILFRICSWPTDWWNNFQEYFAFNKYTPLPIKLKIFLQEMCEGRGRKYWSHRFTVLFLVPWVVPGTFLGVEQHQVHLGAEEEGQGHSGRHRDAHHQAGDLDLSGKIYSFTTHERRAPWRKTKLTKL